MMWLVESAKLFNRFVKISATICNEKIACKLFIPTYFTNSDSSNILLNKNKNYIMMRIGSEYNINYFTYLSPSYKTAYDNTVFVVYEPDEDHSEIISTLSSIFKGKNLKAN